MKKNFYIITAAALSLVACSRNQEVDIPDANLSIFAKTESPADTKTVVESGVHVFWEPGDEIAVFMGEQSAKFTTDITAASGTATFKGTFGDTTWPEDLDLWAVYPFSEDAVFDGETMTTTLPSEQVAREGSFGKDMNLSIAHSNSSTLQFFNVGGGIRFSVTEEGIKKVMFEGLSGEIISGKVKIGFEDGLPVVKEVTGGSQFITLLPPSGQDTFEPGAWYYIVAIPGALDGGYKLRFYKDSDYARKVSEKAVVIKRSIFGSVEKADEGIEYEAQTTHFPETENEWEKSIALTEEIGESVSHIIDSLATASSSDLKLYEELIGKIEGVEKVIMNPEENSFSIMQKDSIWVNYYRPPLIFGKKSSIHLSGRKTRMGVMQREELTSSVSQISTRKKMNNNPLEDYYVNSKRNALLIVPPFVYNEDSGIDYIVKDLVRAGFREGDILIKDEASDFDSPHSTDILQFKGSRISGYDFVFIRTHGFTGYHARKPKGEEIENTTILYSSTRYDKKTVKHLVDDGELQWSDVAISSLDENEDGTFEYYLCMTPSFLDNTHYENSCIIITACHSARILINGNGGSMIQTFLDKNAGIVSGYTNTTYNALDIPLSKELVRLMSNGLSFQEAVLYLQNSEDVISYSQSLKDYFKIEYKETGNNLVRLLYSVDPHNFHFEPISLTRPYHLLDPYPILDEVVPDNGNCELSWEIALAPFDFDWPILSPDCEEWIGQDSTPLTIHYEVYVDGSKLDESTYPNDTQKSVSCSLSPDKHDWYVVAKIMDGGTVIASYQSNEKSFTVEDDLVELEAVDLGLSVNWANMNLGANRPEEYGDHYAWGETEPYYSSLYPFIGKEGKEGGYDWSSYKWCLGGEDLLTKYCTDYSYGYNGFTDYKTVLDPEDDAAHVNLGGNWRMPTDAEWTELRTKCTWKWTSVSGVSGHEVTGPNGKRIFLPAAGLLYNTEHYDGDTYGYYWSSSLDTVSPNVAWGVCFGSEGVLRYDYIGRCDGQSVRPVYGPFSTIPVEVVSLDKTELVLDVGETTVLVATVFPANATNANVIWSSSDESVATVSSTGAVTGVAAGSAVITVTTSDGGKTATCNVTVKETPSSSVTVPEAIDLGLPSGIKWASFNLGATKPEEFGDYYAWGETEPYYVCQNPLVWKEGKDAGYDWASYSLCMGDSNTLTKYCLYPSYGFNGFVDEKTVLDPEDDAAYVNLCGNWKIPTDDEWTELREKCTWEWTSMNGVKGRKVIGLNGNSIFLPIAGYRHGTNIYDAPYCGWYWSSTLYSYPGSAYHVHFSSESVTKNHDIRHAGYSIRPVYAE